MGEGSHIYRTKVYERTASMRMTIMPSASKIKRDYYKTKMQPLLSKKVIVNGNGHSMSVGFTKYGNKHLYSNAVTGKNGIKPSDLENMDKILKGAKFLRKAELYKERKDKISRFYYYKAKVNGRRIFLHVAEESRKLKTGKWIHNRYLYAVTNRKP